MSSVESTSSKSFEHKGREVLPLQDQKHKKKDGDSYTPKLQNDTDKLFLSKKSQDFTQQVVEEIEKILQDYPQFKKLYLAKGNSLASRNHNFLNDPFIQKNKKVELGLEDFYKKIQALESFREKEIKRIQSSIKEEPQLSYLESLKNKLKP